MTYELSAIVSGVEYSLTDGTYCYFLGDDGLGMSPAHRLSERGPQQHGDSDLGYLLDPRFFRLFLEIPGASWVDLFTNRHTLENIFKPANSIIFEWDFGSGFVRRLDAFYAEDMGLPSGDRVPFNQRVTVGFKAGDPTFYDPTGTAVSFALGGGGTAWDVPMAVPWTVGASTIDQTAVIEYAGSAPSWPTIRITGPIANPVITNETTGDELDFTGTTIAGGDYYDIDLRYGSKTVTDAAGANQIADLTDDSDLATWHIAADPDAPGGTNSIRVAGSGITASTKVAIAYFNRYIGI